MRVKEFLIVGIAATLLPGCFVLGFIDVETTYEGTTTSGSGSSSSGSTGGSASATSSGGTSSSAVSGSSSVTAATSASSSSSSASSAQGSSSAAAASAAASSSSGGTTTSSGCGDTLSSVENCGECGNDCRNLPNVGDAATCAEGACVIAAACDSGYADCDDTASGCETNTASDANHCGACGRSCLGATCTNGLCDPELMDDGDLAGSPRRVVVDDTHVYWTDGSAIYRKAKDLSPGRQTVTTLSLPSGNSGDAIGSFDVDATHVYFAANGTQPGSGGAPPQLMRRPKDGTGDNAVMVTMPGGVPSQAGAYLSTVTAADADAVYFTAAQYHEGGPYRVGKESPSLGAALPNASNFPPHEGGYSGNLIIDGARLFVTGFDMYYAPQFGILQCYLPDCANPVQIATPSSAGADGSTVGNPPLAQDSTRVFWAQTPVGNRIVAGLKDQASTVTILATFPTGRAAALAADDNDPYVYLLVGGAGGGVTRVRKDQANQTLTDLVTGQQNPQGMDLDATHIYWGEYQTRKIWRVAR